MNETITTKIIGVSIFIILIVGMIWVIKMNPYIPPADFCANYKPFYEEQCRKCESKGGVYTDSPGGLFGGGSTQCSFPPKL